MEKSKDNNEELRSQEVLKKPEWSSVRALYKAMGYSDRELSCPQIGVFNTYNSGNPGHFNLNWIAEFVRRGILQEGGNPVDVGTIGPCDGVGCGNSGMRFILPSRELIADSVETITQLQHFDGIVLLGSCDKVIPGLLMAAARLNLPTILVNGGPALGGIEFAGRPSDNSTMVEALAMLRDGKITQAEYDRLENFSNPTCGSCSYLGTANTMCAVAEAMGMMLPGSSMVPAVFSERLRVAQASGRKIVSLVRDGIMARMMINRKGLENALRLGMAIGGSTNMALHFPAIANEAEVSFDINDIDRIGRETPHIANIYPNGPRNVPDFYFAGGVLAVMKNLEPLLNVDVMTCTGKSWKEILIDVPETENDIIHMLKHPFHKSGSLAVVRGNIAPDGGITKPTAIAPSMLKFTGTAMCFNSEEESTKAIDAHLIPDQTVIVIRYEGPKGGPGMREMVRIMKKLHGQGKALTTAVVTDGRFSGSNNGCFVGHISPEAAAGGPIAYIKDGDIIRINIPDGTIYADVTEEEFAERRKKGISQCYVPLHGYLARYAKSVGSAAGGAIVR